MSKKRWWNALVDSSIQVGGEHQLYRISGGSSYPTRLTRIGNTNYEHVHSPVFQPFPASFSLTVCKFWPQVWIGFLPALFHSGGLSACLDALPRNRKSPWELRFGFSPCHYCMESGCRGVSAFSSSCSSSCQVQTLASGSDAFSSTFPSGELSGLL